MVIMTFLALVLKRVKMNKKYRGIIDRLSAIELKTTVSEESFYDYLIHSQETFNEINNLHREFDIATDTVASLESLVKSLKDVKLNKDGFKIYQIARDNNLKRVGIDTIAFSNEEYENSTFTTSLEEENKGVIRKIWEAIKKFFVELWKKIASLFTGTKKRSNDIKKEMDDVVVEKEKDEEIYRYKEDKKVLLIGKIAESIVNKDNIDKDKYYEEVARKAREFLEKNEEYLEILNNAKYEDMAYNKMLKEQIRIDKDRRMAPIYREIVERWNRRGELRLDKPFLPENLKIRFTNTIAVSYPGENKYKLKSIKEVITIIESQLKTWSFDAVLGSYTKAFEAILNQRYKKEENGNEAIAEYISTLFKNVIPTNIYQSYGPRGKKYYEISRTELKDSTVKIGYSGRSWNYYYFHNPDDHITTSDITGYLNAIPIIEYSSGYGNKVGKNDGFSENNYGHLVRTDVDLDETYLANQEIDLKKIKQLMDSITSTLSTQSSKYENELSRINGIINKIDQNKLEELDSRILLYLQRGFSIIEKSIVAYHHDILKILNVIVEISEYSLTAKRRRFVYDSLGVS